MFSSILDFLYRIHQRLFATKDTKGNFRNGRKFFFTNMILITLFTYLFISLIWLKSAGLSVVVPILTTVVSVAGLYFKANVNSKEITTKTNNVKDSPDDSPNNDQAS